VTINPSSSSSTDVSLVRRVQERQPLAWQQFVELYGPFVFGWARRLGLTEEDAADVTQETFAAVARAIEGFQCRNQDTSLRGWLWTIVRNKTRDWQRRTPDDRAAGGSAQQERLLEIPEQMPDDSDPKGSRQLSQLLQRGLAQVQDEFAAATWNAFWLHVVEGRSTAEVARELGMTSNYVRQCRSRILRRLREQLGELA
jgi:RNA polymerase sigma-70 factor, ECF subfamily